MARIGVQAMMLKDEFVADGVFNTLKKVTDIGYHSVEISQVPMTEENVAEMERARGELGMDIASLSAAVTTPPGMPGDSLENDFDKIVSDAKRLGAKHLRIGMLPFDAMASLEAVLAFTAQAEEFGKRLRDQELTLSYHNHHIEFTRYDGKYLLDHIADGAPSLALELDMHWVARGGLDPVRTLELYGERVAMVHLKDYRIGRIPAEAFDQLKSGDVAGFMQAFTGVVQFAEVGEGNLDWRSIIPTAQRLGIEHLFVEQDQLYGRTPLEALETSHTNLVAMGFADLL